MVEEHNAIDVLHFLFNKEVVNTILYSSSTRLTYQVLASNLSTCRTALGLCVKIKQSRFLYDELYLPKSSQFALMNFIYEGVLNVLIIFVGVGRKRAAYRSSVSTLRSDWRTMFWVPNYLYVESPLVCAERLNNQVPV
ncbi:hypothetical protein KP509_12G030700 [Ceratopteris richardii]|uniref:Uncharacterized protein n=1 Tax=Ceratopteris richardii TaxID=49495 RepID=A0A8T2THQ6_CERRI|nr:hypothetical protein KP509_12G030700 [Ceratopteris richardii]